MRRLAFLFLLLPFPRYPDDLEAQAFHALSILGTMEHNAQDVRKQMRAAAILEPLLVKAPEAFRKSLQRTPNRRLSLISAPCAQHP